MEECPRPFYVGKGNVARLGKKTRNKHHSNVAMKHGVNRVIVLSTDDENVAFGEEVRLIAEHHTFVDDPFYSDVGCNYTKGGEGSSDHIASEETRRKLSMKNSISMLGNKNGLGCRKSESVRRRISEILRGHSVSMKTRLKISTSLTGRQLNAQHVARSAAGHRGLGKPIEQLNDIAVVATYASAKQAQDATGVNRAKICDCCKGRRQRAGGFGWRYAGNKNEKTF